MRAKQIKPSTFQEFYDIAPSEIQDYIDRCEETLQGSYWHPEGNVKLHINIVFNRAKRTGDINLMLAAIFHDLGKADVTIKHPTIPDKWSAQTHEKISEELVTRHSDWIEELGGDPEIVQYIVSKHMRIKDIDVMRSRKRVAFQEEKYFDILQKFADFDNMRNDYTKDIDD